ncbi:unnamed protein product, partial [Closterium sp. Naga37s-1]
MAEADESTQAEGGSDGGASAWAEKVRAVGGSGKERQLARLLPVLFLVSSSLMPTARRYPLLLRDRRLLHHVRTGLFGVDLAALSIPLDATSAYSTSAAARPHLFFSKKLYLPLHPDSLCGFAASPRPRSPDPLWRTLRAHHLLPPNGLPILNPNWVPRLPNQHLNLQARPHMMVGEALRRDWVVVVSLVWSAHGGREGQGVAGGEDIGLGEGELAEGGAGGGEGVEGDNKEAADAMNRVIVMMRELFGEARVVVYDEHVPLLQAKELFSRAILFVGPTSPALSALIFMPFNSTLIEILPRTVAMAAASIPVVGQQRAATWHFHLASRLGIHHFLSACDPTKVNWHSQERCHVDEVYGTVTAMIRNNPTLHTFTGLPPVSFPPDEPASLGDFRSRIPGSRLRPGTGEAAAFKQWMSCVAERGEWRYNATPRVLPWEEKQPISTSPVATWRGGDGSHPAKFQHTFVPPPAVPPSAGFAFVPRFTALRGEWPSPSPLPATQPSAHAAARRGKEGGGSRRQSRGKGGSVGAEGAVAGAARGEGEQASIGDEEAYLEDGAWEEGNREEDEDVDVHADSGRHGTRMLVGSAAAPPSVLPAARQAACTHAPLASPLTSAFCIPPPTSPLPPRAQDACGAAVPPSALPAARQAACALPAPSSSPLLPASSLPLPRPPPPSMLVVQPRPHPRWLLRAKLGEALRLVDSLTGTDSQWEMEQRSWGGAGGGEAADAVWWGQDSQQRRGGAREWQGEGAQWQGEGEQWRQGEEAEAEWRRRSEERGMRGNGVEGRGRSGDGVEGFGFPPPGGGHPWVVVHSRGRGIRAGSFFGSGMMESIAAHVHASHTMGVPVEAVFVNATLSGVQQRNLEAAWGLPVVDRVGLIIEIFGARANTREAKLQ